LAAKRPGSPLTLLPCQFAADVDHGGDGSGARFDARAFLRYLQRKSIFEKEFRSADDCAPEFRRCAPATHGSALTAR
jgi:hypothetical protein